MRYILRCPFSQARMIKVTTQGQVLYKTDHGHSARFPKPASQDFTAGAKRNFQLFDPLDFLAEVTQHIPDSGEHLIRYYGFYSNKSRGLQAKTNPTSDHFETQPLSSPSPNKNRQRWAALIERVYETDPLVCPQCQAPMKIVSFIEPDQTGVIEKILRHCGLWKETPSRDPPLAKQSLPKQDDQR